MAGKYMTVLEAAEYAGVSRPTLYTMIADGLKVAHIGSRKRVSAEWIDEYFEEKATLENSTKSIAANVVAGMK